MNPLPFLPFLFLTPSETTFQSKYFSANIENYKSPISCTGKIRVGSINNNLFLNRDGLLNATAGTNLKIKKFETFYAITQSKTKVRNENTFVISELLTDNQSNDFGIYLNKVGYEYAQSNKNLEGKVILNIGETSIEKFRKKIIQSSQMFNLGLSHGYFKLISNKIKSNDISNIENKIISSVDYKYLNWVFDGEHKGYISTETKPLNFFLFSDGSLILETDDYTDLEKYKFHKEIEDKNRDVQRIYDLKNQTYLNYLSNPLFLDRNIGFRIKYKDKLKSELKIKFKNIFAFTDFNKKHLVGFGLKGVFLGCDINQKELLIGYKNDN